MKYNLNLTKDYVAHWGIQEAVRELIANTIDEGGTLTYTAQTTLYGEEQLSELIFRTNKVLPLDAFLLGYSAKSNPNAIGQYGEGLKLAMLVLTRLQKIVVFKSGEHFYRFFFEIPEGFGVSTLHLEQIELVNDYDDTPEPITGTEITLFDIDRSFLENCYTYSPVDQVVPNRRGLFCQGLMVESDFYVRVEDKEYGCNLNTPIKTNRDRNYFPDKHLVAPIIEKTFSPEQMFELGTSWWVSSIYERLSPDYKQEMARLWFLKKNITYKKEDLKNKRVLVPSYYSERYDKRPGYLIAPAWIYGSYIMTDADKKVLNELLIKDDELTAVDDRKTAHRAFANRLLTSCREANNINEFIESLVNYIPGLGDERQFTTDEIVGIAYDFLEKEKED